MYFYSHNLHMISPDIIYIYMISAYNCVHLYVFLCILEIHRDTPYLTFKRSPLNPQAWRSMRETDLVEVDVGNLPRQIGVDLGFICYLHTHVYMYISLSIMNKSLHIYIYICMYTCTYIYMYTNTYTYVYIHI